MGRSSDYPTPKKKFHRGTWEIFWNWNYKRYSIFPGRHDPKDREITVDLRAIAAILASPSPDFPPDWKSSPGVIRYLADRYGVPETGESVPVDISEIFESYSRDLNRKCSARWAKLSITMVKTLDATVPGGILHTTPIAARNHLNAILDKGRTPGSRNRALAACSRFFNYCVEHKHATENPFAGIGNMREPQADEIVYCTKEERARIVAIARGLGRADWVAVPIALFAGCRREEIFNIHWEDVNLETRRILIRKSKTDRKRLTPIAKELLEILRPLQHGRGRVVPAVADETWGNQADRLVELVREQLCIAKKLTVEGTPAGGISKREFLMTEKEILAIPQRIEAIKAKLKKSKPGSKSAGELADQLIGLEALPPLARDGGEWLPAERIGWNAWRHTFATLRAQAGVSLDKVSSWMGNSYKVCKQHYAQFMPRDAADEDIDK